MKRVLVHRKSPRQGTSVSMLRPVPGLNGISIAPPKYGIQFIDRPQSDSSAEPNKQKGNTSLPDHLKSGIESLSGMVMDDVRVHYNSSEPAQLQALAYTQGTDIHLGPGQEQHLSHEAWHVVQQKQGRVKPTLQAMGVAINDDQSLEREANATGEEANSLPWDGRGGRDHQFPRRGAHFNSGVEVAQNLPVASVPHPSGNGRETGSSGVLQMYDPKPKERKEIVQLRRKYVELNGDDEYYGERFDEFVAQAADMGAIRRRVSDLEAVVAKKKAVAKNVQEEKPVPLVSLPEKLEGGEPTTTTTSVLATESVVGTGPPSSPVVVKEVEKPNKAKAKRVNLGEFLGDTPTVSQWGKPLSPQILASPSHSIMPTTAALVPPLVPQIRWLTKNSLLQEIKSIRTKWNAGDISAKSITTGAVGQTLHNFVLKPNVKKSVCDELGNSSDWGGKGEHDYSAAHADEEGYVNFTWGPMHRRFNCHVYFR